MITPRAKDIWTRFWMHYSGLGFWGRLAARFATFFTPPYSGRCYLANLSKNGFIAPSATIYHDQLSLGENIFIGDRVTIFKDKDGGPVELSKGVHLNCETFIQTGLGGSVKIGADTHIQPRCQFSAYLSPIEVGRGVEIAPYCAFYPYNHGFEPSVPISRQPLQTKGGIMIDDHAWLGVGVIVLDGVRIGKGAVIGAGAVVTKNIPADAIAFGVPARVVKMRSESRQYELGQ